MLDPNQVLGVARDASLLVCPSECVETFENDIFEILIFYYKNTRNLTPLFAWKQ